MSHFYGADGTPHHFVPCKTKSGNRPSTIKDCKEHGWLPSVTEIIKLLDKPALTEWKVRQGIHAVVTAPDVAGEGLDAKIARVLAEGQDREEARMAADKGTGIHDAIAAVLQGNPWDIRWKPYVEAALPIISAMGKIIWTEKVLVGDGFAGRADCGLTTDRTITVVDLKSAKTLPTKDSWIEHKLQTASYAATLGNTNDHHVLTANIYISTTAPGETALFIQENWRETYERGFLPLLRYYQWVNGLEGVA